MVLVKLSTGLLNGGRSLALRTGVVRSLIQRIKPRKLLLEKKIGGMDGREERLFKIEYLNEKQNALKS